MAMKKITVQEFMQISGLSESSCYRWIREGKLPDERSGRRYWIRFDEGKWLKNTVRGSRTVDSLIFCIKILDDVRKRLQDVANSELRKEIVLLKRKGE